MYSGVRSLFLAIFLFSLYRTGPYVCKNPIESKSYPYSEQEPEATILYLSRVFIGDSLSISPTKQG